MKPLSFQEIIMRLDQYWAAHGCLVAEPYDAPVGAGTNAPATFLRVLGPEPWSVAYPQASRRPADGRYAENPNRFQHFFQYQVIVKPAPADPLGLYLASLAALGVSERDHDVRFVEDNWESPSLGAWGLGWEVWLDGLEITQFTYFQQCGGLDLDPPSVEITYGLERIAMYLQDVRAMVDVEWTDGIAYGEVYRQSEVEHCTYNFELADTDALRKMFELYEAEAGRAVRAGLVAPSHDQILQCSHVFNLLDARGAVGVAQRASYLGRMRTLARRVAAAYVEQRERLGHPLIRAAVGSQSTPTIPAERSLATAGADSAGRADFVLEVGVEELPASDLSVALAQLRSSVPTSLADAGLVHGAVNIVGTPRRLVVQADALGLREAARVETVKGPPVAMAYDGDGNPTRALAGFARGAGVALDQLQTEEIGGRAYVVARRPVEPKSTHEVLAECLGAVLGRLRFARSMYWQTRDVVFSRPVRWIVAVWGDDVVPIRFAGVQAGRATFPPRGTDQEPILIATASEYSERLTGLSVELDGDRRRQIIERRGHELASSVGASLDDDPALLDEVANLVEWPEPFLGTFDPAYLDVPTPALVTVMKKHQRYFPLYGSDGRLLSQFLAVANGRRDSLDLIRMGNEGVLRARFADALYFYQLDLRRPLADYVPELAQVTFLEGLGSMLEKTIRLESLCPEVANELDLAARPDVLARAARLAKADLATSLVRELTELQGEMGREYAAQGGEAADVAEAIADHYRPRYAGDELPRAPISVALAVADRIDTLVASFAAGLEPTGSSDPYGLRRAALGLVGMLLATAAPASLDRLTSLAAERSPVSLDEDRRRRLRDFFRQRLRALLVEQGHRAETVDAVLAVQSDRPANAARTVGALAKALETPDFWQLIGGVKRADRIVPKGQHFDLQRELLREAAELDLFEAYSVAAAGVAELPPEDVDGLVRAMLPLTAPIDRFFTDVLVNADDTSLRSARLGLLLAIRNLPGRSFDVGQLPAPSQRSR